MNSTEQGAIEQEIADLRQGLNALGISYDTKIIQKFQKYVEILYEYKKKIHLLSDQDYNRIAKRHFLTALMAFHYIKDNQVLCDIGTGAGFPSVPLKIVKCDVGLTLFESVKKRAKFLSYLINKLALSDVELIDERAEYYREKRFDVILLKAVGKMKKFINIIDHLIKPDGIAIFYKTHKVEDEIKAADKKLKEKGYEVLVEKSFTPVEQAPLALVVVRRKIER